MATSKYTSAELHAHKADIIETVKTNVTEYFKEYGITITVLGIKEGFSFENPAIQEAIDAKFASEQELIIQQNKNEAAIAKAEAEAQAIIIAAEAQAEANRKLSESLTDDILAKLYYEKWDGQLPQYMGGDGGNLLIPMN